jgi:hypothetical protein
MSLSCYFQKTASNQHMVFRIIEGRVSQLVSQGIPSSSSSNTSTQTRPLDTLEYLARVQALLIYQCIGLYDGNVRLRRLAEQHAPVLERWLMQLLEHVSQVPCCGSAVVSLDEKMPFTLDLASPIPSENLVWYSWIISESMRRTWLIASGVQGVYKLIQNGTGTCLGGTMFTSRRGFWEAPSATVWEKQCCDVYAGLVRLTEVDKMFAMVPLEEINEFAKLVLECTYGVEQAERWGVQI